MSQRSRNAVSVRAMALAGILLGLMTSPTQVEGESGEAEQIRRLTLDECIRTALLQNRALQIERLNPASPDSH